MRSTEKSSPDRRHLILIVDDVPDNIQILAYALSDQYRVKVATRGSGALKIARSHDKPDLILLDVMMPGMDGYEVCRQLREDTSTSDIPVIFVTALNEAEDEERGLNLGAVDYITKPFHIPIVKARVRNHLKLKKLTDILTSLALFDSLTELANRRQFDTVLDEEWRRDERLDIPLSILMADIDFFKQYNDSYGHSAGDCCLKAIATALASSIGRPGDLAARYGGEEFVAILPNTGLEGAMHLAREFHRAVADLQIPHAGSSVSTHVTVSVGVACTDRFLELTPAQLIECADRVLYKAKNSGRNCVVGTACEPPEPT